MPIASSTWLGSVLPEVQALPVDTSMPSRSSAATRSPPSTPSITTLTLFGSRSVSWPVSSRRPSPAARRGGGRSAREADPLRQPRGAGEREGGAEADDPGDVLGPRPPLPLLRAAVELRQHVRAPADEQRADALRPASL